MIEIITDSTCDLTSVQAETLGVRVLPLTVQFGEASFRDGVDLSNAEFYERLRNAQTLPTTSQINPDAFVSAFQAALDRGNQVVAIVVSSELSGTFQSAVIAKEMLNSEDIFVVDSRQVALSLNLLVTEAARLRDEGKSAAEIAKAATELREKIRLYAVVDTLKYLKMGGRISAATAVVGGVLGITPIVAVKDGKVESAGKTRGRKAGVQWIREQANSEELDFSRPLALGHTGCVEALDAVAEGFSGLMPKFTSVFSCEIGAVVGTHAGPGAAGVAYFVK